MAESFDRVVQEQTPQSSPGPADPRGVHAQPPETLVPLQQKAPKTYAAGVPAVISSSKS